MTTQDSKVGMKSLMGSSFKNNTWGSNHIGKPRQCHFVFPCPNDSNRVLSVTASSSLIPCLTEKVRNIPLCFCFVFLAFVPYKLLEPILHLCSHIPRTCVPNQVFSFSGFTYFSECVCVTRMSGAHRGQKKVSDIL